MRLPTPTDPKKKKQTPTASGGTTARPAATPANTGVSEGSQTRSGTSGGTYRQPTVSPTAPSVPKAASGSSAPLKTTTPGGSPAPSKGTGADTAENRFFAATGLPRPGTTSGLYTAGQKNLTKAPLSERGMAETYEKTPAEKPLSQIWAEYKDDPLVDRMVAEEEERVAAEQTRKSPQNMEAVGRAVYESIMNPDRATTAARQAEANAYDLARRGAGGAGTSYAAMAGAQAYQTAYADETARIKEEAEAEQDRLTDAYLMVLDNYNGSNGDSLRQLLRSQGIAESDIQSMLTAASEDWEAADYKARQDEAHDLLYGLAEIGADEEELRATAEYYGLSKEDTEIMLETLRGRMEDFAENETEAEAAEYEAIKDTVFNEVFSMKWKGESEDDIRAYASGLATYYGVSEEDLNFILDSVGVGKSADGGETVSYNQRNVDAIYGILTQTDENGISYYTGYNRNTVATALKNQGYKQEDIDEAIRMADESFASATLDKGVAMAEAIKTGRVDEVVSLVGFSEEAWSKLSEADKIIETLDAMSDLVQYEGMDNETFFQAVYDAETETIDGLMEKFEKRGWLKKVAADDYGTWSDDLLIDVAKVANNVRVYREAGTLTEEQYETILREIYNRMGGNRIGSAAWEDKTAEYSFFKNLFSDSYTDALNIDDDERAALRDVYFVGQGWLRAGT